MYCIEQMDNNFKKLKDPIYGYIKIPTELMKQVIERAKNVRAAIKELLAEGKIVKGDYLDHLGNKTDDLIVVEAD